MEQYIYFLLGVVTYIFVRGIIEMYNKKSRKEYKKAKEGYKEEYKQIKEKALKPYKFELHGIVWIAYWDGNKTRIRPYCDPKFSDYVIPINDPYPERTWHN